MPPQVQRNPFTLNFLSYQSRARNRAAPLLFALWVALQLTSLATGWCACAFRDTWDQHVASGGGAIGPRRASRAAW